MNFVDERSREKIKSTFSETENQLKEWLNEFDEERKVRLGRIRIEDDRLIDENLNVIMRDAFSKEDFMNKMLDHWIEQEIDESDDAELKKTVEHFDLNGKKLLKDNPDVRRRKEVREVLHDYHERMKSD
ncbi:MAG: hypothetical protein ACOCZJ_03870 [Thermoplasmatota archaeon]